MSGSTVQDDKAAVGAEPDTDLSDEEPEAPDTRYRYIIAVVCLSLLGLHLWLEYKGGDLKKLDIEALGIVLVGLSPWLARLFRSAKIFGAEIEFLQIQVKQNTRGNEMNRRQIRSIIDTFIIYSLGEIPYQILWRLGHPIDYPEYRLVKSGEMPRWLNLLLDTGMVMPRNPGDYITIDDLRDGMNIVTLLKPTPAGDFLQELRKKPHDLP